MSKKINLPSLRDRLALSSTSSSMQHLRSTKEEVKGPPQYHSPGGLARVHRGVQRLLHNPSPLPCSHQRLFFRLLSRGHMGKSGNSPASEFLAVQDSSIGDIVSESVSNSPFDFSVYRAEQSRAEHYNSTTIALQ